MAAIHFLFTHEDLLLLIEMINGIIKSSSMLNVYDYSVGTKLLYMYVPAFKDYLRKLKVKNNRGHPDLNWGPLDLQSNALPLSYTPTDTIIY